MSSTRKKKELMQVLFSNNGVVPTRKGDLTSCEAFSNASSVYTHGHFRNTMNESQVFEIKERFKYLRNALALFLYEKLKSCETAKVNVSSFLRLRLPSYSINFDHRTLVDESQMSLSMKSFMDKTGPYAVLFSE